MVRSARMPSDDDHPPDWIALRDARERVIAQLSEAFAHDVIGVDEFERRLTLAHRADSPSDVEATVGDLAPAAASVAIVAAARRAVSPAVERQDGRVVAIFGGIERHGAWTLPRRLQVSAIFGGVLLDLREAALLPGVSEIHVTAIMGGAQILVPPNLAVEVSGTAIMGGFANLDRAPIHRDPDQPLLRIHGFALMGGVAVETRLSGESESEAHRRRAKGRPELGAAVEQKRLPQKTGR
jgi:hypothetical protein